MLTLVKGLPLTYNRDLQEDKEAVFDASDTLQLCLEVYARMLPEVKLQPKAIQAALREGFMEATDLADYLVTKGVPFREAHGIAGRIVRHCIQAGLTLPELALDTYQTFSSHFGRDVFDVLTPEAIVRRRDNLGATAPRRVKAALKKAKAALQR